MERIVCLFRQFLRKVFGSFLTKSSEEGGLVSVADHPSPSSKIVVKSPVLVNPFDAHYVKLWHTMEIKDNRKFIIRKIVDKLEKQKKHYNIFDNVPWYVPAIIHQLECNGDLSRQILNGQRWNQVTTIHPKNKGPFDSFEHSLENSFHNRAMPKQWDTSDTLYFLELWNGMGYMNRGVNSPYIWSFSNHYEKGKYVVDGKYDANAVSMQAGAACILKEILSRGI